MADKMEGVELDAATLPAPRLQLRWEPSDKPTWSWQCHYELVLPLGEHDIRGEVYDDDGRMTGKVSELVAALKPPTLRGGSGTPCESPDGARFCDTPFRDGCHAQWDAVVLGNLPIYSIAPDGVAFKYPASRGIAEGGSET